MNSIAPHCDNPIPGKVFIATSRELEESQDFPPGHEVLVQALNRSGFEVVEKAWDAGGWDVVGKGDVVLPLLTWGYYDDPMAFRSWISGLQAANPIT